MKRPRVATQIEVTENGLLMTGASVSSCLSSPQTNHPDTFSAPRIGMARDISMIDVQCCPMPSLAGQGLGSVRKLDV